MTREEFLTNLIKIGEKHFELPDDIYSFLAKFRKIQLYKINSDEVDTIKFLLKYHGYLMEKNLLNNLGFSLLEVTQGRQSFESTYDRVFTQIKRDPSSSNCEGDS
jgi:hypothetical protein